MDNELRKEFRAWKTEAEDRLGRLEAAQSAKDAVLSDPAPQAAPSKKAAAEAATSEKEGN